MAQIPIFGKGKVEALSSPVANPDSEEAARSWQDLNKAWWQAHPNRYDFDHTGEIPFSEFSEAWFREVDFRFLIRDAGPVVPSAKVPFDSLIPYESLGDVLEVGVGCGSHAELLARHARNYTGIDLAPYAVECTRRRFDVFGLEGRIQEMDVEELRFEDASFDFVWSWGVVHHTSDTRRALSEIARVLRPGGAFVAMVYHRSLWNTYVRGALFYGVLKGGLLRGKSLNRVIQDSTDGALARYFSLTEWGDLLAPYFDITGTHLYGSRSQLVPLPMGRAKQAVMSMIPVSVGRFVTNRPFFGFMLATEAVRR